MSVHTWVGFMLSWTNASIKAGIWLWMIKLQVASKSGIILPRAPQIYHKSLIYFFLLFTWSTCLFDEVDNLLLGGVAGDEVVQVLHDVHADAAGQLISWLDQSRGSEDERSEDEEDLENSLVERRESGRGLVTFIVTTETVT